MLFIHGQKDEMIPFEHTLKLKEECKSPFEVVLPEEMNHNNFDFYEDLIAPLKSFLKRHTRISDIINFEKMNLNKYLSIPNRYFLVPLCIMRKIKKTDEESNKQSVFACLGF